MKSAILPLISTLLILPNSIVWSQGNEKHDATWWEKRRQQRPELYFPHNAHRDALEQAGLSCLACHPFSATTLTDPKQVRTLSQIANEPLKAICHACHVKDRSGPSQCRLCHPQPEKIWPRDHDFDYRKQHALSAKHDEAPCRECHLDLQDCIACHFQRSPLHSRAHAPGYRFAHGLEARMQAPQCGQCHNPPYCTHCHRSIQP